MSMDIASGNSWRSASRSEVGYVDRFFKRQFFCCLYEAVIKMIIKGRSPTMRHVSGTHRVALDWLFDRINLDRKIQIKNVDTTNQLAEMLTTGSLTRDEWDHLLRLLNIMNFSMFSCSHVLSDGKQSVMSKESTAEEGPAEAKLTPINLVSRNNLSAKEKPSARFECFEQPGESRVGSELCFTVLLVFHKWCF